MSERRLVGIHAVREGLNAGVPLQYIAIARERRDSRIETIIKLAHERKVPVRFLPREALDRTVAGISHQGVFAVSEAVRTLQVDELLRRVPAGENPLLVLLDGIEDPHNLGAILRTCSGAGVHGVIVPKRRSVGLNETVGRVSAGALEYVPVARSANLVRELELLKKIPLWVVGLQHDASKRYWEHDFRSPTALVVGAEGHGLHRLTRTTCDFLVSIPMASPVSSLNASVAAAVVLYEIVRQRTIAS